MKGLTTQQICQVSGGEVWIDGLAQGDGVLFVTQDSMIKMDGIAFYSDHVIGLNGKTLISGHTGTFNIGGGDMYVHPYYETTGKNKGKCIGSIYSDY